MTRTPDAGTSRPALPELEAARDQISAAIEMSEIEWSMSLTSLVDGVSTYSLTYQGDPDVYTFHDTDDLYAHVAKRRNDARADAALAAIDAALASGEQGWRTALTREQLTELGCVIVPRDQLLDILEIANRNEWSLSGDALARLMDRDVAAPPAPETRT